MRRAWLLAGPAAFLAVAYFHPLLATLSTASMDAIAWTFTHPLVRKTVAQALLQATLSTVLTLALALPLAWHHHRHRIPFGNVLLAIHAAPFVLPVFVIVFGIQAILGSGGWLHEATGADVLAAFGPLGAIVIAHAYYNYGFAARLIHAALERRPRRLEAAAHVLGASPRQALWRVTWPLLAPSIVSVALLVFLFTFASFGVVLYMGLGHWHTLETLLYEQMRGAFARRDRAAALGVLQLALNFALLAAYQHLVRRQARLPREDAPAARAGVRSTAIAWAPVVLGLMPAVGVLVGGFRFRGRWSLEPWRALVDAAHPAHLAGFDLAHALRLTLLYALASAAIALALTLCLGYGARHLPRRLRAWTETVAALPLGTSSLLIGLGILLGYGVAGFVDPARGRLLIIAAHALVAFPFTARALLPALHQHDTRLDEAASLLHAPPRSVWLRIHMPMLRAPLVAALGLAVAMSVGDFGASLLLMGPENRSIAVWIDAHGGLGSFNALVRAQAVALAGLLMAIAALAYIGVEAAARSADAAAGMRRGLRPALVAEAR